MAGSVVVDARVATTVCSPAGAAIFEDRLDYSTGFVINSAILFLK